MCTLGSSGAFPKKEISAHWHCLFRKQLLTVGGDEQKEIAISPLILNVSVARFLEPIPYKDMHLSTMLENKKCKWILSECNMSCSLLTTVTSNICHISLNIECFCGAFFGMSPLGIGKRFGMSEYKQHGSISHK